MVALGEVAREGVMKNPEIVFKNRHPYCCIVVRAHSSAKHVRFHCSTFSIIVIYKCFVLFNHLFYSLFIIYYLSIVLLFIVFIFLIKL